MTMAKSWVTKRPITAPHGYIQYSRAVALKIGRAVMIRTERAVSVA